MRHAGWLLLVAGLFASPAPAQQAPDPKRSDSRFEEHRGDFDYLLGEWRFTAHHADEGEGGGYWTAVRLPSGEGSHILDEYRLVGEDGETLYVTTTLRAYNESTGHWDLVSAGDGLQDTGTARKVGDEMHIEQWFGVSAGSPWLWRIRYYDIRPEGFSWVADVSADEGATWRHEYLKIQATRIGPARSLEPLARPRPGER